MLNNISVVIIVKDGSKTIEKMLNALNQFSDVVVYDNGSTDDTIEIAKKFHNVNLVQGNFTGFGPTKNKATTYAKNDWILILDSDEVADDEFVNHLKAQHLDDQNVYMVNMVSYYKDIKIKYSGWNNEKHVRLYNRKLTQYNNNYVHEDIEIDGFEVVLLQGNIKHYSYHDIHDFIVKLDRYSTLFAQQNPNKYSSPLKAILNAGFSFFKTYILKRGFLDGYVGLVIAFSHMATNFYKYIKLYELNQKK
jgi:glycosyltransferase involved in cell wall biosynthesis